MTIPEKKNYLSLNNIRVKNTTVIVEPVLQT